LARPGQNRSGGTRTAQRPHRRREVDNDGLIPVLARAVREVEAAAQRGQVKPSSRTKFQVIALLMREERARVKVDKAITDGERAEQMKRLDGVAQILAKTAARDTSLIALLGEDAVVSESAKALKRDMQLSAGMELAPEEQVVVREAAPVAPVSERQVVPQSVVSRQLANPFLPPDFSLA